MFDFVIIVGNEVDIVCVIVVGGVGIICGMVNVVLDLVKGMIEGKDVEVCM